MREAQYAEKINAVWDRVMAARPEEAAGQDGGLAVLRGLISSAAAEAAAWQALARRIRDGQNRRLFAALAGDEARQLRMLQAAWFARAGDSCPVRGTQAQPAGILAALHIRYAAAQSRADVLTRAAAGTQDARLKKLYESFAAQERRHMESTEAVIRRLMR